MLLTWPIALVCVYTYIYIQYIYIFFYIDVCIDTLFTDESSPKPNLTANTGVTFTESSLQNPYNFTLGCTVQYGKPVKYGVIKWIGKFPNNRKTMYAGLVLVRLNSIYTSSVGTVLQYYHHYTILGFAIIAIISNVNIVYPVYCCILLIIATNVRLRC